MGGWCPYPSAWQVAPGADGKGQANDFVITLSCFAIEDTGKLHNTSVPSHLVA